jgi:hypothetical protein
MLQGPDKSRRVGGIHEPVSVKIPSKIPRRWIGLHKRRLAPERECLLEQRNVTHGQPLVIREVPRVHERRWPRAQPF